MQNYLPFEDIPASSFSRPFELTCDDVSDGLLSQIQFITNENLPWSPITASTDVSIFEDASLRDTEIAGHQPSGEHTSLSPLQNFNNIPSASADSTLTTLPMTIDLVDLIDPPLDKLSLSSRRCKFRCRMSTCHKTFDRRARAEACYNKHFNQKPYICGGNCGSQMCKAAFTSSEYLGRHARPLSERTTTCLHCQKQLSTKNIARHRNICG